MRIFHGFIFLFFFYQPSVSQELEGHVADSVTLLFAGDIMGHMPQVHAAFDSNSREYNFLVCFKLVSPILDSVDVAIANLETTLAGAPYSGYPLFSSPDALARDAHAAGFDVLATANNHCYDRGKAGMERTIRVLESMQIPHVGTYFNKQARDTLYPLMLQVKGKKIALLNYTYGTNGIGVDSPNVVNLIDRKQMVDDLKKAELLGADVKVVFLHWGREYELTPNAEQRSLARFLAQQGADIVVGSHPHVVQTFEEVADTVRKRLVPVFYSLGNFISNQRDPDRDGGAMALFTVYWRQANDSVAAGRMEVRTSYYPYWVYKGTLGGKYQYYVLPLPNFLELPLPREDKQRMREYYEAVQKQLRNVSMRRFQIPTAVQ